MAGFELIPFASDTELARSAAAGWAAGLQSVLDRATVYTVALSGGRIAKLFCTEVAKQVQKLSDAERQVFNRQIHFYWADERCVPPADPECNYAIARQLLFEPAGIPERQIHRLRGEEPEPVTLRDAMENIYNWETVVKGLPVFEVLFLGMGYG